MNEQKYNNQDINAYLLGSLPEIKTEHFDELSFTDDEFSHALKSAEKDLVDSYVNGELTGATLEQFNSHYLASPLRREKVEFAKAFQKFAERDAAKRAENSAAEESKPEQTVAGFFSSFNIFKTLNPVLQMGFAAALLFVILGGVWIVVNQFGQPESDTAKQNATAPRVEESPKLIENKESENSNSEREVARTSEESESPPQNSAGENTKKKPVAEPTRKPTQEKNSTPLKSVIASFILTPPVRGGNQIQSLSIPKETRGIVMRLQLEVDDYSAYRVVLVNQSSIKLWRSGTLKSKGNGENKFLNVNFPAKLLKPQIYSLQVSGISADGTSEIISDYPFRVVQ